MNMGQSMPFDEMLKIQNESQYKVQKDRFVGDIDPVTKLRHGQGCYTYVEENPFFQYQGSWNNGVKQTGPGEASTLLMRDGTAYTGEFKNGEITGNGVKQWPDGKIYQGSFQEGEMHGQGLIKYDTSKYA